MKDDLIARLRLHVQEGDIECPDDLLLEAAEALEAASTRQQKPQLEHAKKENGRCESWCYACERAGIQERIKFTEDYESLKFELTTLRARVTPAQEAVELLKRIRGWDMMDATNAVDPVGGTGTEGPRATKRLSSLDVTRRSR